MVALLVFIMATLKIVFGQKKLNCRTQKGPFGGKALKNPVQIDPRTIKLRIRASSIVKPFCLIHSSRMPFYS